ncbi:unnamed protein product [Ilex paraguariensis]|uniref:Uncharacterized protein n=1 Tax=Ilex paraguariensis TaxID=185542 RepID=A0ABC8QRP3_9AQUA
MLAIANPLSPDFSNCHSSELPSHPLKPTGLQHTLPPSVSADRALVPQQIINDAPVHGDLSNHEGDTSFKVDSLVEDSFPSGETIKLDFPPPPLKPVDDKTVQKIEVLCQIYDCLDLLLLKLDAEAALVGCDCCRDADNKSSLVVSVITVAG